MPELPEVETTVRGILPHLVGQTILELVLRAEKLRWPLDRGLCEVLPGQKIVAVTRRAKYLLIHCEHGVLIIHLGMTGVLRIIPADTTERKHDHVDLIMTNGQAMRFSDPRRFGILPIRRSHPINTDVWLTWGRSLWTAVLTLPTSTICREAKNRRSKLLSWIKKRWSELVISMPTRPCSKLVSDRRALPDGLV